MKKSKIIVTIAIIVLLVGMIGIIKLLKNRGTTPQTETGFGPKAKGSPNARLKIEEYSDFQCSICAWGAAILKGYITAHPQEIYVKFNHFPRSSHQHAFKLAIYAECAARQNKFWEFHDALFEQQWRITDRDSDNVEKVIQEIAEKAGMDMDKLRVCIKDPKMAAAVRAEQDSGKARGIKSTPSFFINGKMVVGIQSLTREMEKHFKGTDDE
jgi:protein-disulfide isomerase